MRTRPSRRSILKALGASTALLPFLPILNSEAAPTTFPKRLILFYFPIGTHLASWRCTGGEYDFAQGRGLRRPGAGVHAPEALG